VTPEIFSPAWFSALASIVMIDLVLAGDNAIVIGLAARKVPDEFRRRVILWGTAGAIIVRALLTGVVVWLLKIPGFLAVGGLALVLIGWKLTRGSDESAHAIEAKASVRGALVTIVIADAVMGVDNVLAVGGAAHGSWLLVLIGLALSVPIVVWGSTLVLRFVERYPVILWLGAAVLGWTAAKMIATEPLLRDAFARYPWLSPALHAVFIGGLIAFPLWRNASYRRRLEFAALAVLVIWATAWGFVEDWLGTTTHPIADWTFADEVVDLVRWLGWIPLVLPLARRHARATA
jgi:YjbE family integral membrane protein